MKTLKYFLLALFSILALNVFSQNRLVGKKITSQFHKRIEARMLVGKWFQVNAYSGSDTLEFEKRDKEIYTWGNYIVFNVDRKFSEGYSAPCGNDPNIHYNEGYFSFEEEKNLLQTTIDIGKTGRKYKVLKVSEDKLVLIKTS